MRLLSSCPSSARNLVSSFIHRATLLTSFQQLVLVRAMSVSVSTTPNSSTRRAAIAQLCSTSNKLQNLINVAHCAGLAKQQGACMIFLPECFGFIGENAQQTLAQADPEIMIGTTDTDASPIQNEQDITNLLKATVDSSYQNGQGEGVETHETQSDTNVNVNILNGLQTIAQESGLWISAGGMHVSGAPPKAAATQVGSDSDQSSRVYNTHLIMDNQGQVKCLYRKVHLFDVHIPNKVNLQESKTTAPGTDFTVVCQSPLGTLGLTTCYDVRFPEQYVALRQMGAEILLVPSAFTVPTGSAHWHVLLRARAIEHQCYLLAAAQYGQHNAKRQSYGHSLAVDPWGKVLADAGGCDGPGTTTTTTEGTTTTSITTPSIITCDIDPDTIASVRQRMPIQQHRHDAATATATAASFATTDTTQL